MLENLGGAEAECGVPDEQLGYEIFGALCDVSPVLLWELVLALLDALKKVTLGGESRPRSRLDTSSIKYMHACKHAYILYIHTYT